MSKHTPGPWEVYTPMSSDSTFGIDGPHGEAVIFFGRDKENGIYSIHNARLIAAAPELLEALQQLCADELHTQEKWDNARAAIAKATGEQK
jgi:hypothetical protein